jgi:[acyl-carrier-protein] S-malonyltransferase
VGEYAAFHAAGSLNLAQVVRLVEARGSAMAAAGKVQPGAMAAFLGQLPVAAEELCKQASREGSIVVPANFNSPEQVVVSGDADAVERVMEIASQAGVRKVVRLNVSGAFHSPLMRAAQAELLAALDKAEFADPAFPVYTNVAAAPCRSGEEARNFLGEQLVSPVRWVELVRSIEKDYPESVCLEIGPGKVLDSLVKRSAPTLRTMPCGTAKDLDAIAKVLA